MAQLRKWGPWAGLLLVAAVVLAVGLNRPGHPSLDARAQSIESQVRCPVCNGETVAESQAAPSVEIRNQIRQELQAGQTQSQILSGLVSSYGPGILEKPQTSGISTVVWVLPVIAVVLGAGGLVLVLRRWRARDGSGPDQDSCAGSAATAADVRSPDAPGPGEPVGVTAGPPPPAGGDGPVRHQAAAAGGAVATAVASGPSGITAGPEPPGPEAGLAPASGRRAPRFGRGTRWAVTGMGVALVAAGASWAVVASSGTRLPGQAITGQVLPAQAVIEDLQAASADVQNKDVVGALKEYEKVLEVEPKQAEALTGMGWLLAQTGQPSLLKQGLAQMATAEQADPTYAPAHLYRGLALLGEGDYSASVPELQWYLGHNPDPQLVNSVKQALTQAQAKAAAAGSRPGAGAGAGAAPAPAPPAGSGAGATSGG